MTIGTTRATNASHYFYSFIVHKPVVPVVFGVPNENADDVIAGVPNVNVGAVDLEPKNPPPSDVAVANVILYIYATYS